jgi:CPA2 family monovalent cation:H+ antiporter-2
MHDVLVELVVVMAVSVGAALLLRRLRLPPVVGFLIAGVVVGPGSLGLVTDRNTIVGVAEVGVILLLFTVGLKLKISELWRMRVTVFGSGTAQVVLTGVAAASVAMAIGRPLTEAVTWGMVISLSSTALVLWLLEGSGKTSSAHGRTMVGLLLMQDLAVIPIMLALPLLAGRGGDLTAVTWFLLRAFGVIALTVIGARIVFPALATRVVAAGSRELFTLTTVLVAVGTALVFGHFGLSVALGAFLAGMVVSESKYVSRMVEDVTPLRDVFNSLFFVSLGMLVDPSVWVTKPVITLCFGGGGGVAGGPRPAHRCRDRSWAGSDRGVFLGRRFRGWTARTRGRIGARAFPRDSGSDVDSDARSHGSGPPTSPTRRYRGTRGRCRRPPRDRRLRRQRPQRSPFTGSAGRAPRAG